MIKKISKICFYILFVPYILLYSFSLRAYWTGWTFLFGGSHGWNAVKDTFSFYLILFSVIFLFCAAFQLFYGIKEFSRKKGYLVTAIIPAVLTISFLVYCLWPLQFQFAGKNSWENPTAEQMEKVDIINSILSKDTGYNIAFLENDDFCDIRIDDYALSEMNEYVEKALEESLVALFIKTDNINTFNATECMETLFQYFYQDESPLMYKTRIIYIYEKNVGEIKLHLFDKWEQLKMKETGSLDGTLRGDNYLDDKILIRLEDKTIEYGSTVNNEYS